MTGIVYKYTNKINGIKYVGSHKGEDLHLYRSGSKYLKEALRQFGKENFEIEILYKGKHFRELEEFILNEEQVHINPEYYNKRRVPHPEHQTQALRKSNSFPRGEKVKKQISNTLSKYSIKELTTGFVGTSLEIAKHFKVPNQRDNIRMYAKRGSVVEKGILKNKHFITQ